MNQTSGTVKAKRGPHHYSFFGRSEQSYAAKRGVNPDQMLEDGEYLPAWLISMFGIPCHASFAAGKITAVLRGSSVPRIAGVVM